MPLVVFEGADGCGKSTQLALCAERLRQRGVEPLCLREPGGTALGERLRAVLLDPQTLACPRAELFGYQMARAQLCEEVLAPALQAGRVVLLDRFWYSTIAFQAAGLGLDESQVRAAIALAVGGVQVDLGLFFDLDAAAAAARRAGTAADRIEARGLEYQAQVIEAYRRLAAAGELQRIDASGTIEEVAGRVWELIEAQGLCPR